MQRTDLCVSGINRRCFYCIAGGCCRKTELDLEMKEVDEHACFFLCKLYTHRIIVLNNIIILRSVSVVLRGRVHLFLVWFTIP